MAGLWGEFEREGIDEPIVERKFIVLTTAPNESVGCVHNRMPLIVQRSITTGGFRRMAYSAM